MKLINVRIRYIAPLLGSTPASKELYTNFIATKADPPLDEQTITDERDNIQEEQAGVTVFPRNMDNVPIRYDYQVRGYFKEACKFLRKVSGTKSSGEKAYKQLIDGNIFVEPREIPMQFEGETTFLERPLRASTPQGDRVALAKSEQIPAGACEEFTVRCMRNQDVKLVAEWLEFGRYHGSGQWRNSGIGSFVVEEFKVSDAPDFAPSFKIIEA